MFSAIQREVRSPKFKCWGEDREGRKKGRSGVGGKEKGRKANRQDVLE